MDSLSNMENDEQLEKDRQDIASYLSAAFVASKTNRKKLAIHLYIAAFELDMANREVPSDEVLMGMRNAWDIACQIQDRSSAETLFTELAPFSDPAQVAQRVKQLQEMAVSQLKEMGVPGDRIEKMSIIHTPEATAAGADPDFIRKFHDMIQTPDDAGDDGQDEQQAAQAPAGPSHRPPWGEPQQPAEAHVKDYGSLVGYDSELKTMCAYGFDTADDAEYRRFLQQTSEFHGMQALPLLDPFMFYGPSRDDVLEFAEATAGEVGNPVLTLHVRLDDDGMWTVRLSGPFRRGLFGVSDPTDIPTPATFIIENIDILQDFVKAAMQSEIDQDDLDDTPPHVSSHAAHVYAEIVGYIHAIMQKPDILPILTAGSSVELIPQFDDLFNRVRRVKIDHPSLEERKSVWNNFAIGHTSFSEIDIDELSRLSEGISRHDLITAGSNAVRDAYQQSLADSSHRFVSLNDVLFEMVPFASPEDSSYSAMEDAAAAAFASELDDFNFEDESGSPAV